MKYAPLLFILPALLATTACKKKVNAIQAGNREAQEQLTALQSEVLEKVKTENAYFESVIGNMEEDVARTRSIEMGLFLNNQGEVFVDGNKGQAADQLPLGDFMKSVVDSWKAKDAKLQELLNGVHAQMAANRKKIDVDMTKVKSLKAKLQSLERQETRKARLKALGGFLGDSYKKYKELKNAADAAAPGQN